MPSMAAANRIASEDLRHKAVDGEEIPAADRMPQAQVQRIVQRVLDTLTFRPSVAVVNSAQDAAELNVPAGVNPSAALKGDRIYLFRNRLRTELDVERALFHELFHLGLRKIVPKAEFEQRMRALAAKDVEVRRLAARWKVSPDGKAAELRMTSAHWNAVAVDEALADISEALHTGDTLGSAKQGVVRNILAWLTDLADRFGMSRLAASMRRMSDTEAEQFVRMAVQSGGVAWPTGPRYQSPRTGAGSPPLSPQAQQMLNSMQSASQAGARAFLRRLMPGNQAPALQTAHSISVDVDKIRTVTVDNMAQAESHFNAPSAFNGAVRNALNEVNPMVRMRQAADASKMLLEYFQQGGLEFSKDHGVWRVTKQTEVPPPAQVFDLVAKWAKSQGKDFKKGMHDAGRILEAVRLRELRKSNAQNGTNFVLHMTDVEIDTLTSAYDNDATLKQMTEVMDAPRKALVAQLVQVGRLAPEVGQMWKETVGYVPFDRVKDDVRYFRVQRRVGRGLAQYGQLPELVGSEARPVDNVFTNYVNTLGWMVGQVLRTDAVAHSVHSLEAMGVARRRGSAPPSAELADRAVRVFEKGQDVWYILPSAYDAMAFTDRTAPIPTVFKALSSVSRVLRRAITAIPTFSAKQVLEDAQRAAVHSGVHDVAKLTARIMHNFGRLSGAEIAGRPHDIARQAGALGLTGEYDWEADKPAASLLKDLGYEKRGKFGTLMHKLEGITRASDLAVRQAIYDQTVEETGDAALAQYRAREIINFRRRGYGGNNGVLSIMIQTVPFFNAYLQGMDVLYRSIAGKGAVSGEARNRALGLFYSRAATLVAISSLYALMHSDDDDQDYENMSLDKRDKTWLLGKMGDVPLAVPVPTEIGVLLKVVPERVIQYYKREGTPEQQAASEAITTWLRAGFETYFGRTNPIPQALKPFVEIITNHSFFTGRELEGTYQKQLDPYMRTASTTSEFAKAVAKFVNDGTDGKVQVSPISIDTVLTGYLGTTAAITTMMLDGLLNPDKMDRPLHRMAGLAPFSYDPVGTRHLDEFYDLREKVARAQTTLNTLAQRSVEEATAYVERNRDKLAVYKAVNASLNELEELRKAKAWLTTEHGAASFKSAEDRNAHLKRVQEYEQRVLDWVRQAKHTQGL